MSSNLAWVLIVIGGIVECFWVSGLKYADSFVLYILTGLGILISFSCGIIAMKKIEVSVAYAVFVGIGTAGVVLAEMLYFGENFSLIKFVNKENDDEAFKELSDVVFDEIKEQK